MVVFAFPSAREPYGGIFVLRQAQALQRAGDEVLVARIVPRAPPFGARWRRYRGIPARYDYDGVHVIALRAFMPPRMLATWFVRAQIAPRLRRLIAAQHIDVVHAHALVAIGGIAVRAPVPVVVTAHGSDAYRYPWRRRDLLRLARAAAADANALVATSDFVRRSVQRLQRREIDVVPNGADERTFAPCDRAAARERLGIAAGRPTIAFAGNLLRGKGLIDLAQACAMMRDLAPLVILAGAGPDRDAIAAAFTAANVEARFLGALRQDELAQVFAAADLVTLPSHGEGLPTVLCEAMLCARAIVATRVGGIPEIVTDRICGRLVPPGDPVALRGALHEVLADAELRDRYGAAAFAFARAHLTWRTNAQAYRRIYARAVARFASS